MKIVIDIPHSVYENIINGTIETDGYFKANLRECFKNGTLLPKHHGRLIDADALLDKKQDYGEGQMKLILIDPYYVRKAPTIIEAEGSESE